VAGETVEKVGPDLLDIGPIQFFRPPLLTCEPVLKEAAFRLLQTPISHFTVAIGNKVNSRIDAQIEKGRGVEGTRHSARWVR